MSLTKKRSEKKSGQAQNIKKENKSNIKERKTKNKEKAFDEFDLETEQLIQMTNKNRIKKEARIAKQNEIKENMNKVTQIKKMSKTTTQLHNYTTTQLHNYTTTQLHNYTTTQLHNYTTTQIIVFSLKIII